MKELAERSPGFLWICEEPLDAAAGRARKSGRRPIRPVKVEKRHSGGIELCAALDKLVARAVRAHDSFTSHGKGFAGRCLTHRLHAALNRGEEILGLPRFFGHLY